MWAVKDGKAELPCDINPPDPTDQVYLVLWYRDLAGKPLYSYDLRWADVTYTLCNWHLMSPGASPPRPVSTGQRSRHLDSGRERGFGSQRPRASRRWWSRTWRCWTRESTGDIWQCSPRVWHVIMYRCRVDYRNSPTRNMKLNLTVVGKKLAQGAQGLNAMNHKHVKKSTNYRSVSTPIFKPKQKTLCLPNTELWATKLVAAGI